LINYITAPLHVTQEQAEFQRTHCCGLYNTTGCQLQLNSITEEHNNPSKTMTKSRPQAGLSIHPALFLHQQKTAGHPRRIATSTSVLINKCDGLRFWFDSFVIISTTQLLYLLFLLCQCYLGCSW